MSDKRQQWEQIKAESPDFAEFLKGITQAFGKPQAVSVTLLSGNVIRSGDFQQERAILKLKLQAGSMYGC